MGLGRRLVTVVALAGLLVGCGGGSQASPAAPKHGGTLRTAIGIDPDTLDPAAQTTTTASQIVVMMAETLVTIDTKGAIKPLLATSWSGSSDGLAYTFTLRQGVKFQDGTPFNAQAVKFSIDRLLSPTTFRAQPNILGGRTGIDRVDALDDSHVRFTLKTKLPPFVAALTQPQSATASPPSGNAHPNRPQAPPQPVATGAHNPA